MSFNVLVVNCGSSSIKYQVIDMDSKRNGCESQWTANYPERCLPPA